MEKIRILTKLRYKIIFNIIIKYITPTLYYRLISLDLLGKGLNISHINIVNKLPRPAIIFMKRHFNNKLVKGVELGVNYGNNAKSILKQLKIKKLYLIDIWDKTYDYNYVKINKLDTIFEYVKKRFKKNTNVRIIKEFSHKAVHLFNNNSLDFIYIDGNHSYNFVYKDIDLWYPKIKVNGISAGHDIFNIPDVLNALKDWTKKDNIKYTIRPPDWFIIKEGLTCETCGYYDKDTSYCMNENIIITPNNNQICVCYFPLKTQDDISAILKKET